MGAGGLAVVMEEGREGVQRVMGTAATLVEETAAAMAPAVAEAAMEVVEAMVGVEVGVVMEAEEPEKVAAAAVDLVAEVGVAKAAGMAVGGEEEEETEKVMQLK